jgi:hypothetical protein
MQKSKNERKMQESKRKTIKEQKRKRTGTVTPPHA